MKLFAQTHISYPAAFEAWWRIFPTRAGDSKADAYKSWRKVKLGNEELMQLTRKYAETQVGRDPQYRKGAAAWLNGRRWEAYLSSEAIPTPPTEEALVRAALRYTKRVLAEQQMNGSSGGKFWDARKLEQEIATLEAKLTPPV